MGDYAGPGDGFDGLAGVIFWTAPERFEAMREFYVERVGMHPQPARRAGHLAFAWGTPPDYVRLIIGVHDGVQGANPQPERTMVNLLTYDLEHLAAAMTSRGVEFTEGPMRMSWGGWIATFRDPDGNTVQLLQPAPQE